MQKRCISAGIAADEVVRPGQEGGLGDTPPAQQLDPRGGGQRHGGAEESDKYEWRWHEERRVYQLFEKSAGTMVHEAPANGAALQQPQTAEAELPQTVAPPPAAAGLAEHDVRDEL